MELELERNILKAVGCKIPPDTNKCLFSKQTYLIKFQDFNGSEKALSLNESQRYWVAYKNFLHDAASDR